MFRTGHPRAALPATLTPKNRRGLRLPEHQPYQPEPDGRQLPQLIWPDLLPDLFADRRSPQAALARRALLAMALAKVGSTRARASSLLSCPNRPVSRLNNMQQLGICRSFQLSERASLMVVESARRALQFSGFFPARSTAPPRWGQKGGWS